MATARAIASGNWSATSTWNGGVLPGNGDTVYANGFTVAIDQNITIGGANNPIVNAGSFVSGQWYEITSVGTTTFTNIGAFANTVGTTFQASGVGSGTGQARARATLTTATNTAAGATSGGGNFTMSAPYEMTCDLRAGTSVCLTISNGSQTFRGLQIIGGNSNAHAITSNSGSLLTIQNSNLVSNVAAGGYAVNITGIGGLSVTSSILNANGGPVVWNNNTGSLTIEGSSIFAGSNYRHAIQNNSTGSVSITNSTITGGLGSSPGLQNASTGQITISNSTVTGGSQSSDPGIANNSAATIIATNSTFTAGSGAVSINNSSTGTLSFTNCTFTAVNGVAAISSTNTSATNRFSGTFISSPNGTQPINATRWILNSSPTVSYIQHALDGINANSFVRYFTADNNLGQANPTDVRSGVSYASGYLTGRLTVPARGSVALSVNYGPSMPFTATRNGTTATATLAYSYPLVVGDQIAVTGASNAEWNGSYTIASVVSETSVTFVVPATHSATAGTGALMQTTGTAVLDPTAVASAVWGAASRTITGGLVDTATTLTNAPASVTPADIWSHASRTLTSASGPTAVQIRQEIDANSTKLDAAISSRLAASAYTAPTSAPTAASVANAVWSAAARTITGGTVDTLTNAPTVPSAAAIATQVWAVADKTGYSLTSAERSAIAAAVEASILNEGDGQAILNAIVTAIGNSNVDQVALVAAIRTELERNGGNLSAIKAKTDNLPAAPAAIGDIPTESEIAAAVWSKPTTELTISGSIGERAKNQSTVSTTGAQLAAALS